MRNAPAIVFRTLLNGLVVVFSGTVTACVLVVLLVYAILGDRDLSFSALQPVVEEQINRLAGSEALSVQDLKVNLGNTGVSLRMKLLRHGPDGRQHLSLPDVRATLSYGQLFAGRVRMRALRINSAYLELRRGASGELELPFGGVFPAGLLGGSGELIDQFAEFGPHSILEEIKFSDVTLAIESESLDGGSEFRVSEAGLVRDGDRVAMSVSGRWLRRDSSPMRLDALLTREVGAEVTRLTVTLDVDEVNESSESSPAGGSTRWISPRFLHETLPATLSVDIRDGAERSGTTIAVGQGAEIRPDEPAADAGTPRERAAASTVDLTVSSLVGTLEATGELALAADEDGEFGLVELDLAFTGGQLSMPWFSGDPVHIADGGVRVTADIADGGLEIDPLWISDGEMRATAAYAGNLDDPAQESLLRVEVDSISMPRFMGFWPTDLAPKVREWITRSVGAAKLGRMSGSFRLSDGVSDHDIRFGFEDADFRTWERLPAVTGGRGSVRVRNGMLELLLDAGRMTRSGDRAANLYGSRFTIADLAATDLVGEINLNVGADLALLMHVFDGNQFLLSGLAGFLESGPDGHVRGDGSIGIRFEDGGKVHLQSVKFTGEVRDLRVPIPGGAAALSGKIVTADALSVSLQDNSLALSGRAEVDGHSVEARWTLEFRDGQLRRNELDVDFNLSEQVLEEFGIALPQIVLDGQSRARLDIDLGASPGSALSIRSDLVGIAVSIPALRWQKSHEQTGAFILERSSRDHMGHYRIRLESPGLVIEGLIEVDDDGRVLKLQLPRLAVGDRIDTSVIVALDGDQITEVVLHRGRIDLRSFRVGDGGAAMVPMDLSFDRVIVNDQINLTDFRGKLGQGGRQSGEFSGKINGEVEITGKVNRSQDGMGFVVMSEDGGGVARATGYFKSAYGGDFRMEVVPADGRAGYDASFRFRNVRVENASVLAELLNLVSVAGLLQQLSGEGLHFDNVIGNVRMRPDGIRVSGLSAVGPSVGISLAGWYDPVGRSVDFEGVIAPVLLFGIVDGFINTVFGPLLGGRDSASIIGFNYRMRGPVDDPTINVNPLSILTPGRFREIFRQDAPRPPASE